MKLLGISTETHDTGIAIIDDGSPVLILEEERLNRRKHTRTFPAQSLAAAFGDAIDFEAIDAITTCWDHRHLRRNLARTVIANLPAGLCLLLPKARPAQDGGIVVLNYWLRKGLKQSFPGRKMPPLVNVPHHDSHAAIFFASPFDEAAVVVLDGYGDETATSIYAGNGNRLERRWCGGFLDSIGIIYTTITRHLGFDIFEEGTVMALAACGTTSLSAKMRGVVRFEQDGHFSANPDYLSFNTYGGIRPFTRKFFETFGPPRKRDEPLRQHHMDLAFALQSMAEDLVLHVVRAARKFAPSKNLCLTGGVALNCVANARIIAECGYENVWVPPCASDTGGPLGSALWHYHQDLGHPRRTELKHAYYGLEYSANAIRQALTRAGLSFQELSQFDLIERVAKDLASDRIVGWYQGRYEIGPRALGNRSILASPLKANVRDVINARIKFRESFRPFAPSVLQEYAARYFEDAKPNPFMTVAFKVRPEVRDQIPAVVHIDGTARVQTIDRDSNPRYYALIDKFREITGVPVLINTSFNKQEPIVTTPEEAISCFLRTDMDVLAIGDFYCEAKSAAAKERALAAFTTATENLRGGE